MCLNAKAAAAAESSDVLMPLMRISITEGRKESPLGAESSHFEYAPIVKHTENFNMHKSCSAERKKKNRN